MYNFISKAKLIASNIFLYLSWTQKLDTSSLIISLEFFFFVTHNQMAKEWSNLYLIHSSVVGKLMWSHYYLSTLIFPFISELNITSTLRWSKYLHYIDCYYYLPSINLLSLCYCCSEVNNKVIDGYKMKQIWIYINMKLNLKIILYSLNKLY